MSGGSRNTTPGRVVPLKTILPVSKTDSSLSPLPCEHVDRGAFQRRRSERPSSNEGCATARKRGRTHLAMGTARSRGALMRESVVRAGWFDSSFAIHDRRSKCATW